MKIARTVILLALVVFVAAACSRGAEDDEKEAETLKDQAYGSDPLQVADVYIPKDGGDGNGVVILIHGGSWIAGDKDDFESKPSLIAEQGYVVVNMNYRLADPDLALAGTPELNTVTVARMLDDIDAVKAYIRKKASKWDCDAGKIALVGASAGAHLALMDALTRNGSGTIKACVSFSGPTDFADSDFQDNTFDYDGTIFTVQDGLELIVGTAWDTAVGAANQAFIDASPIEQSLSQAAHTKFLLVHGELDTLVPYAQAQAMRDKLDAGDVSVDWYLSPTDGHDLKNCIASVLAGSVLPLLQSTIK